MKEKSDNELILIVQKGNKLQSKNALNILYVRYSQVLFQFMFFILNKDEDKARDFVHDIFLQLFEKKYRFDSSKNFKSWLFTIAANKSKNELRRLSVIRKNESNLNLEFSKTETAFEFDKKIKVWNVVNQLEEKQRQAVILRFRLNWTIKEIATFQECPEGTVKSRLFNALKKLSSILEKKSIEYFN